MKIKFPLSICEDSLTQCWNYMDKTRRQVRVRALTAKAGGFFSNLTFFFCLFFGGNGLILRHFSGSYCTYLQGLSLFVEPWKKVSSLFPDGSSLGSDSLRLLLLSYLSGIAVFLVLYLLITLLYHPRKQTAPEGSYPEKAQQLASLTLEAWQHSFKTHITSSVVSILLVVSAIFILFVAYTFYLDDADAMEALLSRFPTSDMKTNVWLYVIFAYIIGHFLCLPLLLVTRPLYYSAFPYALVAEAAAAALFAGDTGDADPEHRRETALSQREEALRAEYRRGYQIAKDLYLKAALGGDVPAMEHYARHCLLDHRKEPARYWLDQAAASGEISPEGKNMRQRLKLGRNMNVGYLQEGVDGSLKAVRRRSAVHLLKNILSLVLFLGITAAILVGSIRYLGGDENALLAEFKDLMSGMSESISEEIGGNGTADAADNITLHWL